jgi:hypothetical protein
MRVTSTSNERLPPSPRHQRSSAVSTRRPLVSRGVLLLGLAMAVGGCVSRAELITLREGMDGGTATIRRQHLAWAQLLSQGRQTELPTLSAAEFNAVQTAHQQYNDLVTASRAQDQAPLLGSNSNPRSGRRELQRP